MRRDDDTAPTSSRGFSRATFLRGAAGAALGLLAGADAGNAVASGRAAAGHRAGYVKDLTGEETARFGFRGTDLGFTARTNHGYCITIFGDTFDQPVPQNSTGWRSPVGLRQSNTDIHTGIRWDNCIGGGRAKELIPYVHTDPNVARHTPGLVVTEIPNDLIHLPDGRYMMTTFGVRDWAIPDQGGTPSPGGSWRTWYSRQWTSTETHAENWTTTWNLETNRENMDFWNEGLMAHFQNNAMIMWPGEDWVYIYGTNEGRWNGGGIHLMRVPWNRMWERGQYTFWGADGSGRWDWRPAGPSTPIIGAPSPFEAIGEIAAEVIDGRVVLSFLNGGRGAVTQTAPYPTGLWSAPRTQVTFAQAPNLYAPVVHPYSTTGNAQLLVSQWINPGPNSTFYGVRQWSGSVDGRIAARGTTAERLVVMADEPALPGHVGPVSPQWQRLPVADQVAILSDNCDSRVSRADIAAGTLAATSTPRAGAWATPG
ncbi:DUF4185 domain-containing protein [Actinophytocola algeriensis]|uniref:DUF4185 domain-containing protein n=1 Tax=Actinophytocola algeriensis TaxID=1768010 RepID=A0A7W7Q2P7_9PSEU|nr:DUF4185 domain-containing protein [Actinophytocola algeriensis]MBB4905872.1 hypothetical protein [Actinophytocola algeriensis]MBE1472443.1 hypothetical protein [Actinophytocola algeriensis]